MGIAATNRPPEDYSCTPSPFGFVSFMAFLTAFFWFMVMYTSYITRNNISFQNNLIF